MKELKVITKISFSVILINIVLNLLCVIHNFEFAVILSLSIIIVINIFNTKLE